MAATLAGRNSGSLFHGLGTAGAVPHVGSDARQIALEADATMTPDGWEENYSCLAAPAQNTIVAGAAAPVALVPKSPTELPLSSTIRS